MPAQDIPQIEGLDVETGLRYTGTLELYFKLLAEFSGAIERRAGFFRTVCANGDTDAYRVEVHSLKSNARTLGAEKLAKMAEAMEERCKAADLPYIRAKTPELLEEYEKYIPILESYKKPPVVAGQGELDYDSGRLLELCARMLTALDDFDIDRAELLMESFLDYKANEDISAQLVMLKQAVDSYSYGQAEEITQNLMAQL